MLRKNALISQSARRFLQKHQTAHQLLQTQAFNWSALRPVFLNEIPKGFDRYFRKNHNNNSSSSSSSSKKEGTSSEKAETTTKASEGGQETKKSDSSNKNKGGGKKPDHFDPEQNIGRILLMLGGLGVATYLFSDNNFGR